MGWVEDHNNAGPWTLTKQEDKWGYINNAKWSSKSDAEYFCDDVGLSLDPDHKHQPCGHWHKGDLPPEVLSTEEIWQQSIDVLKTGSLLGVGGMSAGSIDQYIIYITDFAGNITAGHTWGTADTVSGVPGVIKIIESSGTQIVFYGNVLYDTDYYSEYWVYKLTSNGVYSSSKLFFEYDPTSDDYAYKYFTWDKYNMAISSSGVVVVALAIYGKAGGVGFYDIYTYRSTDLGSSWGSAVKISVVSGFRVEPCMACDSNGIFYVATMDYSAPNKPFRLWKSTDNGDTWNEINTVPTTPVSTPNHLAMDISGTKIYVVAQVLDGTNKTYIWSSTDSGATWAKETVEIAGVTYFIDFNIAANGDVVVMACRGGGTNTEYIIRSTDAGANWIKIGQRDPALDWPTYIEVFEQYVSLNNDSDVFVFTACGDYILDTDYLGYLLSQDDGATWTPKPLTLSRVSGVPTYGASISDEPQVWPFVEQEDKFGYINNPRWTE